MKNESQESMDQKIPIFSLSLLFIAFLIIIYWIIYSYETAIRYEYKFRKRSFAAIISKQFDGIAGEHQQLKEYAKNSLQFPYSYKHIDTIYMRNNEDQELLVKTLYTGEDTFKTERVFCAKAIYTFYGDEIMAPEPCDKNKSF